jgi:prolyl 4-hydroxylase
MSAQELSQWRVRASAGDVEAKAALGRHLVLHAPHDLREGVEWTASAAKEGNGEAAYLLAVLNSAGMGVPHDLRTSLTYLQQAAENGHRNAQMELAALVGNWRLAREISSGKAARTSNWSQLRAAVDIEAWLRVPDARILSSTPRIAAVKEYLSGPTCDWLVRLGKPYLRRAEIFDSDSGTVRYDTTRDNDAAMLEVGQIDTVVGFVRSRIAALADVPVGALETTQVLRYEVGQQFDAHFDFLDVSKPGHARDVEQRGQRALTVLIYLNEDYEGGETAFPDVGSRFKGRKGDALVLWNLTEDGAPDRRTRHIGTAPTRGVKWLLSQWIRIRAT